MGVVWAWLDLGMAGGCGSVLVLVFKPMDTKWVLYQLIQARSKQRLTGQARKWAGQKGVCQEVTT